MKKTNKTQKYPIKPKKNRPGWGFLKKPGFLPTLTTLNPKLGHCRSLGRLYYIIAKKLSAKFRSIHLRNFAKFLVRNFAK
jgi:hypothetical protein